VYVAVPEEFVLFVSDPVIEEPDPVWPPDIPLDITGIPQL
jgi:hypothetical protein